MKRPVISIILPVYKVEKYLNKCIDSILNQSFKDFELIIIDDGSPDKCGEICESYSKFDERIKVIHKKNEGLSSARNLGIDRASGEYLAFIDSDDYINERMFEILYIYAKKTDADITLCNFRKVFEEYGYKQIKKLDVEINTYDNIGALKQLYNKSSVEFTVAWNKLYKRGLFSDLRYDVGKVHEDEFIIHKLLFKSKKIVHIPLELYYYVQRENSIVKVFNYKRFDIITAHSNRVDFFKDKKLKELKYQSEVIYIAIFFETYYRGKFLIENSHKDLLCMRNNYKKRFKSLLNNPILNWKEKIVLILFFIHPNLYEIYYKIKNQNLYDKVIRE